MRHYFENHDYVAESVRKLLTDYGRTETPTTLYVRYFVKKVKETAILIDKPKREKPKTVSTNENIATMAERVREAPSTSIQRRSQQLIVIGQC